MITWEMPRLSTEWVGPITVSQDEVEITNWTYGVFPRSYQPTSTDEITALPMNLGGELGVLIGPEGDHDLPVGHYRIWVRYDGDPQNVVINNAVTVLIV